MAPSWITKQRQTLNDQVRRTGGTSQAEEANDALAELVATHPTRHGVSVAMMKCPGFDAPDAGEFADPTVGTPVDGNRGAVSAFVVTSVRWLPRSVSEQVPARCPDQRAVLDDSDRNGVDASSAELRRDPAEECEASRFAPA